MKLFGKELRFNNNKVYHTGDKPIAADIKFTDGKTFQQKLDDGSLRGPQGLKGDTGPQGPKGIDGLTTSVTIGSTKYTHSSGNITIPAYPTLSSLGGAASNHTHSSLIGTTGTTIAPSTGTGIMRYDYNISSSNAGTLPVTNNANGILTFNMQSGNYYSQLGFSSNSNLYYRNFNGTALNTTAKWRRILTSSEIASNENGFFDKLAYTNVEGVTEIGRHLDFHIANDKTNDYNIRVYIDEDSLAKNATFTTLRTTSAMRLGGYADYTLQAGTSEYGAYIKNHHTGKFFTMTHSGDVELGGNNIYIQAGIYDSRLQSGNYQIFNTDGNQHIYFGNFQSSTVIEGKDCDLRLRDRGRLEYSGGFINVNQAKPDHGFGTLDRHGGFIGRFTGWDADCVYINTYSSGTGNEAASYSRVKINGHFLNVAAMANFESSLTASYMYSDNALNVSSDRNLKENITYIRKAKDYGIATLEESPEKLTLKDMYRFVKDELVLATYNMKTNDSNDIKLNFIAQDLLYNENYEDSKVGQIIVNAKYARENDTTLKYDTGNYTSVLAGALQYAIDKIEYLENKINNLTLSEIKN